MLVRYWRCLKIPDLLSSISPLQLVSLLGLSLCSICSVLGAPCLLLDVPYFSAIFYCCRSHMAYRRLINREMKRHFRPPTR